MRIKYRSMFVQFKEGEMEFLSKSVTPVPLTAAPASVQVLRYFVKKKNIFPQILFAPFPCVEYKNISKCIELVSVNSGELSHEKFLYRRNIIPFVSWGGTREVTDLSPSGNTDHVSSDN